MQSLLAGSQCKYELSDTKAENRDYTLKALGMMLECFSSFGLLSLKWLLLKCLALPPLSDSAKKE